MRLFILTLSLLAVLSIPAFGDERFVINFSDGKSVFSGELLDLVELIEHRDPGYAYQNIIEVIVEVQPRDRKYRGYVQLLDSYRRVIAESPISAGYAALRVYENKSGANFLNFDTDVYLTRLEIISEQPRYLKPLKQKEVKKRRPYLQIGEFVKPSYSSEVKKFPIPHGGFSKINFKVQIREKFGVIVNGIVVLAGDKRITWKTVGTRLSNGDNTFSLDVPEEATDIQVSFDHGQGSAVQIFLLR